MKIIDLLRADGFLVVNKSLIKKFGLETAIFLADLISRFAYFLETEKISESDYFFVEQKRITEETGLSKYQQRRAVDKLTEIGILKVKRTGVPPRNYYQIDFKALEKMLLYSPTVNTSKVKNLTFKSQKFDFYKFNFELINNNNIINNIIKESAQKKFSGSSNTDDKQKNNNTNPLNALSKKNKDAGLNNSLTGPACPTALHALEPEEEVPRSNARKVLFKNAGIDYDEAVRRFRQMPENRKAKYRGLDIDYYLEVVDDWSVAKNVKRTPEGWWRTILQFMRSDMEKGRARYIELKPKKSYNPYV